jgi:hypothetical protein
MYFLNYQILVSFSADPMLIVCIFPTVWKTFEYRNNHEAHFEQVTESFLHYVEEGALPDWAVPNMISKYYVTTQAWKLAKSKVFSSRNY